LDRGKAVTDTIGFYRMEFSISACNSVFGQSRLKLKLHAAEAGGIQKELVTG